MVQHSTARQKFCSYKTEESLQVEPQSNSSFYGSARYGTTYKTGLRRGKVNYFVSFVELDFTAIKISNLHALK